MPRIPADLLQRLEAASRDELEQLLTVPSDLVTPCLPDPVETTIAWDLAAGF